MRGAAAPSPFDLGGRPALSQIESAEEIELSSESDSGMIGVSFDFRDGAVTQRSSLTPNLAEETELLSFAHSLTFT